MHLKLADPAHYPFGLLSIYNRELGYSIAEDAARMAIPKELHMTFPLYDDNTFFRILEENFESAIETYIGHFAIEAAVARAKQFFMDDVVRLRRVQVPVMTPYIQALFALAQTPVDPTTNTPVDIKELAAVVSAVRQELRAGLHVEPASYLELVKRYLGAGRSVVGIGLLKDLHRFTDLGHIVETAVELDKNDIAAGVRRRVEDCLLDQYLDMTLAKVYPHIPPEQYTRAKDEQRLRGPEGPLRAKLYTMWRNGYISLDSEGAPSEQQLAELLASPSIVEETPVADASTVTLADFPRLALDYKHRFVFHGGVYRTPVEYGQRKALALFNPEVAEKTHTADLITQLGRYARHTLKERLRTSIYTFVRDKCMMPHFWILLNYPETVEWKGDAGIVGEQWLSAMYTAVKTQLSRPAELDKPLDISDLTVNPLTEAWFKQRVQMLKPISTKHRDLFLALTDKFRQGAVRFPTINEKCILAGCDYEVWQIISSDAQTLLSGSAENAFSNIIREVTDQLPVLPSLKTLTKIFIPIYQQNNLGYASVSDMVASIVGDRPTHATLVLWTRMFL